MRHITLGSTGIVTPQNAFGALPIQRCSEQDAIDLVRRAFEGGMTFFDTARAYTTSEERVGKALSDQRDKITIATKTMARTPEEFWRDLDRSLELLQTDHVDIYQLHCVPQCYRPGDGTGMYECLLEAKRQGKVLHIGATAHLIVVAEEIASSGLYETLQFPLSYLASDREEALVELCRKNEVGFIAMKGLAGGLIRNSRAAMAYISRFDNVVPIWGIQRDHELDEWLSYFQDTPSLDDEIARFIEQERRELVGEFCRGCGYCMPCPSDIPINNCARMSLMIRRAPASAWLSDEWQEKMSRIEECQECGICKERCPYGLDVPVLLRKNYEDYQSILKGETKPE